MVSKKVTQHVLALSINNLKKMDKFTKKKRKEKRVDKETIYKKKCNVIITIYSIRRTPQKGKYNYRLIS
jgi:hypothetical protein